MLLRESLYMAFSSVATYIEEVQLVGIGCTNAVCKQQKIALQPFHLKGRILETDTGTQIFAHFDSGIVYVMNARNYRRKK